MTVNVMQASRHVKSAKLLDGDIRQFRMYLYSSVGVKYSSTPSTRNIYQLQVLYLTPTLLYRSRELCS